MGSRVFTIRTYLFHDRFHDCSIVQEIFDGPEESADASA